MDIVAEFVANYRKKVDFYEAAAILVAHRLEDALQASGIRAIVTHRAKSATRLEQKCRRRNRDKHYTTFDDIYADIADIAGIRVALYFPGERDQVSKLIEQLFTDIGKRKTFPDGSKRSTDSRFLGYSAVHYRICLAPEELLEAERLYAGTRVEIQVASVFMHAWAEVEHDLVYKSFEGQLSQTEYAILDSLNGLALTGEVSLELLQRAGEARIAARGHEFANHYELAVYLLRRTEDIREGEVGASGLGHVDRLARFLERLELNRPEAIEPYLAGIHDRVELRPIAEQVADAILAEDGRRYDLWRSVRIQVHGATDELAILSDTTLPEKIGFFIARWIELESILGFDRQNSEPWPEEDAREFESLRGIRNGLVHGKFIPTIDVLDQAGKRLQNLTTRLRHGFESSLS